MCVCGGGGGRGEKKEVIGGREGVEDSVVLYCVCLLQQNGNTPLHRAASSGLLGCVEVSGVYCGDVRGSVACTVGM